MQHSSDRKIEACIDDSVSLLSEIVQNDLYQVPDSRVGKPEAHPEKGNGNLSVLVDCDHEMGTKKIVALLVNAQEVERSPHTDMQGLTLVLGLAEDDAQVASVASWGSESLDAVNSSTVR